MVKRYSYSVEDGGMREQPQEWRGGWIHSADYDALEAEWMALSQDDGKVERALESAQARIRELEALLTAREDTLVCMREEYLHLRRITESARDLLQGEFYAEALGELDDACSPPSDEGKP